VAVRAARAAVAEAREAILTSGTPPCDLERDARARAAEAVRPRLRRVLNATGVIVHTNLGRAPLARPAVEAVARLAEGYSNLEYDLAEGRRGSRQSHVEGLLCELTGADAALAVNNCAAAVLLGAAVLASGRELVVSRGQLVEIGGSFRIPEVVEQSRARLVEVGTTNRTRLSDYRGAIRAETGAILRVHQSNFRAVGFVEDVEVEALCGLGVPVMDDVGSGRLAQGIPLLEDEPSVHRSVAAGCALVSFSGDKLLGGPQAGLIVGRAGPIESCRSHPLARAMRIDKLSLAALEATLRIYLDPELARAELPVLRFLEAELDELAVRAEALRSSLAEGGVVAELTTATAKVGGGALPLLELPGPVCALDPAPLSAAELAHRLRLGDPPLLGRIQDGRLLLDPRTLADAELAHASRAVVAALR
jgi:L-seryl-tRNA(Ser) seleniumtransferase